LLCKTALPPHWPKVIFPDRIVKEVYFILGLNNTIKINDAIKPLITPSGEESELKIKIDKALRKTEPLYT
jgi:hypothetical protein